MSQPNVSQQQNKLQSFPEYIAPIYSGGSVQFNRINNRFAPLNPKRQYKGVYERCGFEVYKGEHRTKAKDTSPMMPPKYRKPVRNASLPDLKNPPPVLPSLVKKGSNLSLTSHEYSQAPGTPTSLSSGSSFRSAFFRPFKKNSADTRPSKPVVKNSGPRDPEKLTSLDREIEPMVRGLGINGSSTSLAASGNPAAGKSQASSMGMSINTTPSIHGTGSGSSNLAHAAPEVPVAAVGGYKNSDFGVDSPQSNANIFSPLDSTFSSSSSAATTPRIEQGDKFSKFEDYDKKKNLVVYTGFFSKKVPDTSNTNSTSNSSIVSDDSLIKQISSSESVPSNDDFLSHIKKMNSYEHNDEDNMYSANIMRTVNEPRPDDMSFKLEAEELNFKPNRESSEISFKRADDDFDRQSSEISFKRASSEISFKRASSEISFKRASSEISFKQASESNLQPEELERRLAESNRHSGELESVASGNSLVDYSSSSRFSMESEELGKGSFAEKNQAMLMRKLTTKLDRISGQFGVTPVFDKAHLASEDLVEPLIESPAAQSLENCSLPTITVVDEDSQAKDLFQDIEGLFSKSQPGEKSDHESVLSEDKFSFTNHISRANTLDSISSSNSDDSILRKIVNLDEDSIVPVEYDEKPLNISPVENRVPIADRIQISRVELKNIDDISPKAEPAKPAASPVSSAFNLDPAASPASFTSEVSEDLELHEEPVVEEEYKYPSGEGPCRKCNLEIQGKSIWSKDHQMSGQWHRSCFSCYRCDAVFQKGTNCYVLDDKPYCNYDFHFLNNSLCKICNTGIEGQCLENNKQERYHRDCLRCVKCSTFIVRDYFVLDGKALCEKDGLMEIETERRKQLESAGLQVTSKVEKRRTVLLDLPESLPM